MCMRTIDAADENATVKDIIFRKLRSMSRHPWYFYQLFKSLRTRGQTVPLAIGVDDDTGEQFLVNGHHRVIIACLLLHWPGMQATQDPEESVDRPWSEQHAGAAAGDW
jgi:hypothetical protein